jgi:adenylate cyclase
MIALFVCEDERWALAERYPSQQTQKATVDAKLSLRAGGVSAVRVLRLHSDPQTRRLRKDLLYDAIKPGETPPPPPPLATPSNADDSRPAPSDAARGVLRPETRLPQRSAASALARPPVARPVVPDRSLAAARGKEDGRAASPALPSLFSRIAALFSFAGHASRVSQEHGAAATASVPPLRRRDPDADRQARTAPSRLEELHQQAKRLLQFLQECLTEAATRNHLPRGQMDANLRFGFHLFMLGAGTACLAATPENVALADLVEAPLTLLGSDPAKARSFAEDIDAYKNDSRHAAMIRAGCEAMACFLRDNRLVGALLAQALRLWQGADRNSVPGETAGQDVAIMFTDMVSSVETTQQLGDAGMMKLVEQHDLIVAAVLKTKRGHQVKHTGDGIMAVFPRVGDGIAAAAEIQRQIAEYNAAAVGAPLMIRIGLSAGNPIRKDDDYFGTVVQTAARICPIAGAGEVALTDAMACLPECDRFSYSEPLSVPLKGFSQPQLVRKLL